MSNHIRTILQRFCDWEERKTQRQHLIEMGVLIAATILLTILQHVSR